jgi:uncharacterized protein (DUF885 family)
MRIATLLLATAIVVSPVAAMAQAAVAPAASEGARLRKLFTDSDEAQLKRNPIGTLFRGDPRYADQFGDQITDAYYAAEKAAAEADLRALAAIDRAKLTPAERISYDTFKWSTEDTLGFYAPALRKAQTARPIDHFYGIQSYYPSLASGEGAAPFKTVADYENNLKRLAGYVTYLDRAIGRMRGGLRDGITNPKLVMQNVVDQLDALNAQGVEGSVFYKPVTLFPDAVAAADRMRLTAAFAAFVRTQIIPAHTRLATFLKTEYLPKARAAVGLSAMPGGAALYAQLVRSNTTTGMKPDAIHALGVSEVARIQGNMKKVMATLGFKGTLADFFKFMASDPQFAPKSAQAMRDAFFAIDKRLEATIGREFATLPKSRLAIEPVPAYREKTDAAGSYNAGTPDGTRPGVFYYNAYDLPTRFTWGYETLFLHEGRPGHHFQISLAQENEALPPFQRFGGNTAFAEGWALYAETLGPQLGLFTDPYQLYGHYNDEILRAMRLVVDTGIHSKGWTRDRAITYMMTNSAMGKSDATAEVERYIAIPGQALAYKIGSLTIQRLRARAEAALGARFDPRAFHAQVLDTGALPMAVLERKIDAWIAGGGK